MLPNYHREMEMLLVLAGEGTYHCASTSLRVGPGCLMVTLPGTLHALEYDDRLEILGMLVEAEHLESLGLSGRTGCQIIDCSEQLPFFRESLALVERAGGISRSCAAAMLDAWAALVSDILLDHSSTFCFVEQNELAKQVFNNVILHFREPITVARLARDYDVSPSYLSRIFREYARLSPMEAVIRARIYDADMQLLKTRKSVREIMLSCGYEKMSAFQKAFVKRNGCAPLEFRRRYAGQGGNDFFLQLQDRHLRGELLTADAEEVYRAQAGTGARIVKSVEAAPAEGTFSYACMCRKV